MAAADSRAELSRRQDLRAAGPTLGSLGKWEMEPATIHAGLDGMKYGPSPEHATEGLSPAGEHFSIFDRDLNSSDFQNRPGSGISPQEPRSESPLRASKCLRKFSTFNCVDIAVFNLGNTLVCM